MKTLLKVFSAIAALTLATAAFANEETVSLGYKTYYDSIEIDLREYGSGGAGTANLYCDNTLVFSADLGGITYMASGVYCYVDNYGFYHVSQLPEGEYAGGLSVNGGSLSTYGTTVEWESSYYWDWIYADFL